MNRSNCCFTDCRKNNFNRGLYLDVCELIWFKLSRMIDTVDFYIVDTSLHDL